MEQNNQDKKSNSKDWLTIRNITIIAVLLLALFVALSPGLVYAPVPKVVLYLLISLLPAILFGSESAARFELNFKVMTFSTVGAAAIILGTLFSLTYLSKPEQQIAVYHIYDENHQPVIGLDREDAVKILLTKQGYQVTKFIDENSLVLIFPEQVGECEIQIRPLSFGPIYTGKLKYAGNREMDLYFGNQLNKIPSSNRKTKH